MTGLSSLHRATTLATVSTNMCGWSDQLFAHSLDNNSYHWDRKGQSKLKSFPVRDGGFHKRPSGVNLEPGWTTKETGVRHGKQHTQQVALSSCPPSYTGVPCSGPLTVQSFHEGSGSLCLCCFACFSYSLCVRGSPLVIMHQVCWVILIVIGGCCLWGKGLVLNSSSLPNTYIHIHTCIQSYIHSSIHTNIHTYKHAYKHTHIRADRQTYTHSYTHTNIHTYIQTYIHTYKHTYIHTFIHSCIHTYIHARKHTSIHTHYTQTYYNTHDATLALYISFAMK